MLDTKTDQYLAVGVVSTIVSWLLLPLAGLVSIYSSYKIHGDVPNLYSYVIAGLGGTSVLFWVAYLSTL